MTSITPQGPAAVASTATTLPSKLSSQVDLLVSLHLWAWPVLTLAIQNGWGGSTQVSNDKRDWLAGAVSELLMSNPPQLGDVGDLEEVLLQVMLDEFEVVVDDGSVEETASKIWKGVDKLRAGDLTDMEKLQQVWQERQRIGEQKVSLVRGQDEEGEETDWDDQDEDEWNGFGDNAVEDVDMDEAPPLLDPQSRQKMIPEVDEDGFTKVVSKKKR